MSDVSYSKKANYIKYALCFIFFTRGFYLVCGCIDYLIMLLTNLIEPDGFFTLFGLIYNILVLPFLCIIMSIRMTFSKKYQFYQENILKYSNQIFLSFLLFDVIIICIGDYMQDFWDFFAVASFTVVYFPFYIAYWFDRLFKVLRKIV